MVKKILFIFSFLFVMITIIPAQTIYQKDRWGAKLFYIEDNTIKQNKLFYIEENTVKMKDRWGDALLYFDGNTIRQKDRWGTPLYYLDGNVLKQKDRWGQAVYYFDFEPTKWVLAAILLM